MRNLVELRSERSGTFEIDGRAFSWRMVEEWISTDHGTEVSCQKDAKITISKREGISEREMQSLKSCAEGQIGVKDFLSIKTSLEQICSYELSWFSETTVSTEINLSAPKCGAEMYLVYQLIRSYYISTMKKRIFRRPVRVDLPTIKERTNRYVARVISDSEDERCPCGTASVEKNQVPFLLTAGNLRLSMEAEYTEQGVQFRVGGARYQASGDFERGVPVVLERFPAFFVFLAGLEPVETDLPATLSIDNTDLHQSGLGGEPMPMVDQVVEVESVLEVAPAPAFDYSA